MFAATFLALAAIIPAAMANVFITSPVASTSWAGGSQQTVSWQDDGASPTLAAFGNAKVSIYVGNAQQQTLLQPISPSVNVATTSAVVFTIDPTIGPNGNNYFIRVESLGLKDTTNPQYPALAFSAKFTLTSMTGTFNASVQSEINGASTAPLALPSSPASASIPSGPVTTAAPATTKPSAAASASGSAKPSTTASASGAAQVAVSGFAGILGAALAVLGVAMW